MADINSEFEIPSSLPASKIFHAYSDFHNIAPKVDQATYKTLVTIEGDGGVGSDNAGGPSDGWITFSFRGVPTEHLRERVRAGLAHARMQETSTAADKASSVRDLVLAGIRKSEIARRLDIGLTSVFRLLNKRNPETNRLRQAYLKNTMK